MRSGTAPFSLVALLVAVLLNGIKWAKTELFRKRNSTVAQQNGMDYRWLHQIGCVVTSKEKFVILYKLQLPSNKLIDSVNFELLTAFSYWKNWCLTINVKINCKCSSFKWYKWTNVNRWKAVGSETVVLQSGSANGSDTYLIPIS